MIYLSSNINFFIANFSLYFWVSSYITMAQLRNLTFVYDITLHSIFIKSLEFVTLYLKVFLSIKQNFYFYAVAVTCRLHIKNYFVEFCQIFAKTYAMVSKWSYWRGRSAQVFSFEFTSCLEQLFYRTLVKDFLGPSVLLQTFKIKKQHFRDVPCQNGLMVGTGIVITTDITKLLFFTTLTNKTFCKTCCSLLLVKHWKSSGKEQHCKLFTSFLYH